MLPHQHCWLMYFFINASLLATNTASNNLALQLSWKKSCIVDCCKFFWLDIATHHSWLLWIILWFVPLLSWPTDTTNSNAPFSNCLKFLSKVHCCDFFGYDGASQHSWLLSNLTMHPFFNSRRSPIAMVSSSIILTLAQVVFHHFTLFCQICWDMKNTLHSTSSEVIMLQPMTTNHFRDRGWFIGGEGTDGVKMTKLFKLIVHNMGSYHQL